MKTENSISVKESDSARIANMQNISDEIIGREKEIKALSEYLEKVDHGHGHFVILNGEAGIGKSTLMNHFAHEVGTDGYSYYTIQFQNFPIYDPYQPFLTLVDKMNGAASSANHIPDEDFSQFNLKNAEDDSNSFYNLQDRNTFIRQFIVSKIVQKAQQTPLLIILDDMHLASQTTWQFLHYLREKIAEQKVLILAALRQDGREITQDKLPIYVEIMQRMSREGIIEKIKLGRFTRNHVRTYLSRRYAKSDFAADFITAFHKTCDGLPANLSPYSKLFEKKGLIYCQQDIWYNHENLSSDLLSEAAIEQSELEDLHAWIENLSPGHLKLLKYAALINCSFDHVLVAKVLNRPKVDVLKDLIYLCSQKFLFNSDNEEFQFKHTSTQVAVKKKINVQQLQKMHQKIAESIEKADHFESHKKVFLLAHHYNLTNNKEKAFRYLFLAGNLSMQNLAFQEANIFYQQALTLPDYNPQAKRRLHLYIRCAWNDRLLGLYEQSLEFSKKAYQLANKNTNKTEIQLIFLQQAFTYFRLRDWKNATLYFKKCLENKKHMSFFSQATSHYGLASVYFETGNYSSARQYFDQALSVVQKLNNSPSVTTLNARILNNLGALESVTGNLMQAIRHYSESIPLYEKFSDNYGVAQVFNNIGLTYAEGQNWTEANKSYGKSLGFCDLIGNLPLKSIVFLNRAYALTQLERIDEADEYNAKAYRLIMKLEDQLSLAEYHKIQGIIERRRGQWDNAVIHFDTAIEIFKKMNNILGYAESAYERGLLARDRRNEKGFIKWLKLSMRSYRELGLGKKVLELTEILNRYSNEYNSQNKKKEEALVS